MTEYKKSRSKSWAIPVIAVLAAVCLFFAFAQSLLIVAETAYAQGVSLEVGTINTNDVTPDDGTALDTEASNPSVLYRTHVQNIGWQKYMRNGKVAGTSGKALRLEALKVKLASTPVSGGVTYRTHIQNIGWQGWKSNGKMSGTSGKSLRLEAVQIKLTGNMAKKYDIYYRVHCQNFGWMGWAKNGAKAGSAGYSYRLEALQVKLVKKGGAAPGSTKGAFKEAPFVIKKAGFKMNLPTSWRGSVKTKTSYGDKYNVTTVCLNNGAWLLSVYWGKIGSFPPGVELGDSTIVGSKKGNKYVITLYHQGLWLDLNWTSSGCQAMRWSSSTCNKVAKLLTNGKVKSLSQRNSLGISVGDCATSYLKKTCYKSLKAY